MTKKKRTHGKAEPASGSPVTLLEGELASLRLDLRRTMRAYAQRLEDDLHKSAAAVKSLGPVEALSPESLRDVREMMMLMRRRKLKPEKGRRKDLRKIDSLIEDLQLFVPANGHSHERKARIL